MGHIAQESQKLLEKRAIYGIRIGVVHLGFISFRLMVKKYANLISYRKF